MKADFQIYDVIGEMRKQRMAVVQSLVSIFVTYLLIYAYHHDHIMVHRIRWIRDVEDWTGLKMNTAAETATDRDISGEHWSLKGVS